MESFFKLNIWEKIYSKLIDDIKRFYPLRNTLPFSPEGKFYPAIKVIAWEIFLAILSHLGIHLIDSHLQSLWNIFGNPFSFKNSSNRLLFKDLFFFRVQANV